MSYFRLVDTARQFFDSNGDPLSGGKLYTYEAGSTTNKSTFQDDAGDTAHANPIILDAAGRTPAEVFGTTGAYKLRLDDSDDTTIWTRDDITGINDTAEVSASEWVASGLTPTYVSATSFTFAGDQTTVFHKGRRLKITDSGGTDYATITASSYSDPNTTITCVLDSGSIDSGISAVSYGLVSAVNTGSPSSMHKITSGAVSAAATLDLTNLSTAYAAYLLIWSDLVPATDNVGLWVRTDSNNGASFDSGATDYAYAWINVTDAGTTGGTGSTGDTKIELLGNAGTAAAEQLSGQIMIFNPGDSGQRPKITWDIAYRDQSSTFRRLSGSGERASAGAIDAVRVLFSSGNIATMNYTLYGLRA